MTKPVKIFLIVIGILSIFSGTYSALSGAPFSEYFFGLFIGVTLIGSVFMMKTNNDSSADKK